MKIVNLFAGPGAGKSTLAAGLFFMMKNAGMKVELVTEYAKDVMWEKRFNLLDDQCYLFAKQLRRLNRLKDHKIEWAITDSPLLLSCIYVTPDYPKEFKALVHVMFDGFDNRNFRVQRMKPYYQVGRTQTEDEAAALDMKVHEYLDTNKITFLDVPGDATGPIEVLKKLGIDQQVRRTT